MIIIWPGPCLGIESNIYVIATFLPTFLSTVSSEKILKNVERSEQNCEENFFPINVCFPV